MHRKILAPINIRGFVATLVLVVCAHSGLVAQDSIRLSGPASFCAGDSVLLTAQTTLPSSSYQWLKDDADIPGAIQSSYKVFSQGKYTVTIRKGNKDTTLAAVIITVRPNPTAAFTFSPNLNCANIPVNFDNNSTGANLSYAWNFGSGNTSTAVNPSHRFVPNAGAGNQNFNVRLIVTTAFGCKDTSIQQVTVKQLPPAKLNGTGEGLYDGKTYFKVCSGVNNADITIVNANNGHAAVVSNRIVWGDQSPDFVAVTFNPINHNYQLGIYNMQLITTGTNGCIDTVQYGTFIGSNPAIGLNNPGNTSICTGSSLTFPITGTAQNPPGTTYEVVFNDNTPSSMYSHPPPAQVTHTFDLISCGITSGNFPNSFSATITAANPCLTSQAQITPIYVSQKPKPDFSIAPGDTVCINKVVNLTNTSPVNKFISGGVCQDGKMVWKITPATGWTTTGTLGNDQGLNDPSLWQAGSNALPVTFTATGTYTIKLKLGNTICGIDSLTKTICVNPEPVAAFSVNADAGCAPLLVSTTNNSNQPICGENTYQWTVSYNPFAGCTPGTSNYTLLNNTTLRSENPVFQFNNPGTYTLTLITKNSDSICVSAPVTRQITVRDKPNANFNAPASICQHAPFTPVATGINNCGVSIPETYLWDFTGATPGSSTNANPGSVQFNTAGPFSIKLSVTNTCGTTEINRPITVNPTPEVTMPANEALCQGQQAGPFTFSSVPTGASFAWTNNNTSIGLAASGNGNINAFTTLNSGSNPIVSTIRVTPTIGTCAGPAKSFTLTVNPRPQPPVSTNPVYCTGDIATPLSANVTIGDTLLWYTTATGGTPIPVPTPSTASPGTATFYVSQQVKATGCESNRTTVLVTVRPVPVIGGAVGTNPTTCATATGSITLSGLAANSAFTVSYNRNGTSVSVNLNSNGSGNILIASLPAGIYDNIRVNLNGCPSAAAGPVSLSDPNPPASPVATAPAAICSGNTINLGASTTTPGAVTYTWSGPNNFTSTQQNPNVPNATTAASGTYSVVARLAGCTSASGTVNVLVNQTPAISATSNSPVCEAAALNLTANSSTPGTVTFAWTGPNGFSASSQNPSINPSLLESAGNYSVISTLGTCSSAPFTVAVVVRPTPVIGGTTHTDPTSCATATGSITLNGLTAGTTYQVTYTRNGTPVSVNLTANASGNVLIANLVAGTYDNIKVSLNGCPSAAAGPISLSDPNPPATPVAGSNGPVCTGTILNLNATTATTGAVTYQWSGPNGFSSTQQNPAIPSVTTSAAGTYSVVARLAGCTSAAGTVNVLVNQTPDVTPGSNSPVCEGEPINLTASTGTPGNVTFAWTGPDGFSSNTANPSIAGAAFANAGQYSVASTLGNCTSAPRTVAVVVKPTPVIGSAVPADPISCIIANGSIMLTGLTPNTAFQVTYLFNNVAQSRTLNSNGSGNLTITNLAPGNYTNIRVTLNGCTSAAAGPLVLNSPNPPATPTAASNAPICVGTNLTLSATSTNTGVVTYNWSGPNNFSSAVANPVIPNAGTIHSGTYQVTATVNGCVSAAGSVNVLVSATAAGANAGPDQQICNQPLAKLAGNNPGNGTGRWEVLSPSTAIVSQPGNPNADVTNLPIGTTRLIWHVNNNVCPPSADTMQIVNLPELISHIEPLTNTICFGQTATVTGLPPAGGTGTYGYQWQQSANGILFTDITGASSANLTISPATTTWYRRVVGSGACSSFGDTALLTVLAPITQNTLGSNQDICINTTPAPIIGAVPAGGGGAYTYQWQFSTNNGTIWTDISGASSKDFAPGILQATTQYRRVVQTALCTGPQTSFSNAITITVNPDAQAQMAPAPLLSCAPFRITPFIINLTPFPNRNGTYNWYANNNFIGSGTAFPGYTVSNAGDSVRIKLVTISLFGCKPDSAFAMFKTVGDPSPSFTASDTVGCGPLTVSFTNTTPNKNNFLYTWDFGNGRTSIQNDPGSITFATNPNFGDTIYTVTLRASAGCDTFSVTQKIRVRSKAKVSISPNKVEGCSPAQFTFTNISRGSDATYTWDFGDGSPQQNTNATSVQHSYNVGVRTFFTVKLISKNDCGIDTGSVVILVTPNPIRLDLLINATEINGCAPHTVSFVNTTTGASFFRYNFGDGTPDLVTNTSYDTLVHTYQAPGTYTITMTAGNTCTDTTTTRTVVVDTAPKSAFTYAVNTTCIGQPVSFQNRSDSGVAVFWRFGDGTTSSVANPQKTWQRAGTYTVKHYASTTFGQGFTCTDSTFATIIVRDTLTGDFTVDSLGSCAPFFVTLKSTLRPSARTFWEFGDGTTGTGDSVVHAYGVSGNYVVNMYSTDAGGCTYKAVKTLTVNGPSGQLSYTAPFACVGVAVPFRVSTSNTARFIYYFGNGDSTITTNNTVNYTYPLAGTYRPRVVLQSGNCSNVIMGLDSIRVDKVQAAIVQQNTPFCGYTNYRFDDAGLVVFGKGKWSWSFGDGSISTVQNPLKTYTTPGVYNVGLRLTGLSGCSDSVTIPIRVDVQKIPRGSISADSIACIGQVVNFAATVQQADSTVSFGWDFGNGNTATGPNASTTYNRGGLFTVSLITRTAFGCADTTRKTVSVSVAPLVSAGPDLRICRGQTVQLRATEATTFSWSPTDGLSCANCPNPVAQPVLSNTYIVTGSNGIGCSAKDTISIAVVQPFTINYSTSDTICLGERIQLGASGAPQGYIWSPATGLNSSTIANPLASPTITTTYRVIGYDNFNCFSDTGFVTIGVGQIPTVDLGTGGEVIAGNQVPLQPRFTNGPFVNYAWTPTTGLNCTNCANPIATITTNVTYSLTVTNPYGCTATDTIGFRVQCVESEQVYIPNAFSPDNDGVNDVFMVRGKGLARVKHFRVFNRVGQVVFERNNFDANDPTQGWDGRVNGIPASPDVYVYTAELLCTGGASYYKKGNVTLVR